MQAEQQSALLPCPFCLTNNVSVYPRTCDKKTPYDARDRAFPVARCACGASMDGKDWGDEQTAIDAWNRRAALSHPSTPQGWISVSDALPPEREMVAVGWMDVEDHDHADRYSIDYLDDGVWQFYFSEHEHYLIAGVAKGRSEDAPYTHWQRIGAIPAPQTPESQP